jgi:hypothetical protein
MDYTRVTKTKGSNPFDPTIYSVSGISFSICRLLVCVLEKCQLLN